MKIDLAYGLYMAEAENCFPKQRKENIEAVISDLAAIKNYGYNPNEYIEPVLKLHNLKECLLTPSEKSYINHKVNAM